MDVLLVPRDFGESIRASRKASGKTQSEIAKQLGCRRQTIADLEAGKNVGIHTVFWVLTMLDKGLVIANKRIDTDRLQEIFDESED